MTETVLILGAKGRFGRATATAFVKAGWHVRLMARGWDVEASNGRVEHICGNALEAGTVAKAAEGADVIVNALNPPYGRWAQDVPTLTANVIAAAQSSGATVMIPGNVYNYGEAMPPVLLEMTKHAPTTELGHLREELEQAYRNAARKGVQTIILRAGDFIEGTATSNWFESQMVNKIESGKITYPGPLDQMHAWAYLPDLGRACAELVAKRDQFGEFEQFNFEGFNLTGAALIAAIEQAWGKPLKVKAVPWWAIKAMALFVPDMAGVAAMSYLWRTPHAINGTKFARALPDFIPTPMSEALTSVLQSLTQQTPINAVSEAA